ncbi:MAG: T9SS type A sorting domain-containing protein, partial [bacterium]
NQTFSGLSNPFVVSVSPYTPTGYEVDFWIKMTSAEATYTFADSQMFSFSVGEFGAIDPSSDASGTYFGYESSDTIYSEAPAFEWMEIDPIAGGSGEVLPFSTSNETLIRTLPFPFRYWGQEYTSVSISTDGWIAFGSMTTTAPANDSLPHIDAIPGMIAGLWCDLWHSTSETGRISTYYDTTAGKYYIEYYQVSHYVNPTPKETFQMVLCDPALEPTISGDGEILFYYHTLHLFGQNFATSGIESPNQFYGIEESYNNQHPVTSHGLSSALAVKWTTDPPAITAVLEPPEVPSGGIPLEFTVATPYPNPFNSSVTIRFDLPIAAQVKLEVFDLAGRNVEVGSYPPLHNTLLSAGTHQIHFDGSSLTSGMYIYRLTAGKWLCSGKMVLLK